MWKRDAYPLPSPVPWSFASLVLVYNSIASFPQRLSQSPLIYLWSWSQQDTARRDGWEKIRNLHSRSSCSIYHRARRDERTQQTSCPLFNIIWTRKFQSFLLKLFYNFFIYYLLVIRFILSFTLSKLNESRLYLHWSCISALRQLAWNLGWIVWLLLTLLIFLFCMHLLKQYRLYVQNVESKK